MRKLDLSCNRIRNINTETFKSTPNLEILKLNSNIVTKLETLHFEPLTELKLLDLSSNSLKSIGNRKNSNWNIKFVTNKKLTHLYLQNNLLGKVEFELFDKLKNLELLNLSHNRLQEISTYPLSRLVNLRALFLHENCIRYLPENTFMYLNELQLIFLNSNRLAYLGPNTFLNTIKVNGIELTNELDKEGNLRESKMRCVNIMGNSFNKNFNLKSLFPYKKFPKLKYLLASEDYSMASKLVDSKHFKEIRDYLRTEIANLLLGP